MEKMGKQQFSNEEIREAIKELLSVQKVELAYTLKQLANFKSEVIEYTDAIEKFGKQKEKIEDAISESTSDGNSAFRNLDAAIKEIKPIMKDLGLPNAKETQGVDKILSKYKQIVKKYS